MATRISRLQDIEELTHINDLLINEIERRAQPVPIDPETGEPTRLDSIEIARTPDEDEYVRLLRSIRSQSGFLGTGESFKSRLQEDWNTVVNVLQTTHIEVATHLKNLLKLCGYNKKVRGVQYTTENADGILRNSFKQENPQFFDISHFILRGFQYSLFANLEKNEQESPWNDEYLIKNCQLGIEIRIGGNLTHGVISYIESFGFYEGESFPGSNPFRIDPMRVMTLLTGKWNKPALAYEIATEKMKLQTIQQQILISTEKIEQFTSDFNAKLIELATLKSRNTGEEEQLNFVEYEKDTLEGEVLYLKNLLKEQHSAALHCEMRLKQLLEIIL